MKRAAWRTAMAGVRRADLVFLDASGASIRLTRAYARAPKRERAVGRVPRNHGKATSLVAALTPQGLRAPARRLGARNADSFAAYVAGTLAPALRPGQVVVLDNLSVHKDPRVRAAVEAAGCRLVFLPPYSPDFSPIELAYAKVKAALRKAGARAQDALDAAAPQGVCDQALATITPQDAAAFFRHCGYSLAQ
ncbi:MAG TPA: IS630 family transposase [Chloroflexota bacterium]|nr:IS630 family transposase [Chloroflexota bacterium]